MYNETYEDYIRNILGYPKDNSYEQNYENYGMRNNNFADNNRNLELESYYPEIYKIVNPMIVKKCSETRGYVSKEQIENMTDEIYYAIEGKNEIELNINLKNNVRSSPTSTNSNTKSAEVNITENKEKKENRQFNSGLRDLIKILLIRQLLNNRPGFFPRPRPPMPPRPPMRPPYGPGPGPGPRPPFPREFETNNYDIYEI